jgi:hypothetical protein
VDVERSAGLRREQGGADGNGYEKGGERQSHVESPGSGWRVKPTITPGL